jgi:hypothetical protein
MEALCVAAPLLRTFTTDLWVGDHESGRSVLRNEAPFEPLRLRLLDAFLEDEDEAAVVAFSADVAAHASLTQLSLFKAPLNTAAALDAVVDATLARRLQRFHLFGCRLSPASAPALAHLLSSDALTTLGCRDADMLDAPAARVLATALRANSTLTSLTLDNIGAWRDPAAGAELLGALHGHASLRVLCLRDNVVETAGQAAAGAALGALIAANAPALTELNVSECELGDDGMRPLFEALPRNTHLRVLYCLYNAISEAFARDVLLPALRANTSLRKLVTTQVAEADDLEHLLDTEAAVNSRPTA